MEKCEQIFNVYSIWAPMTSCLSFSANACLALSVSGSIFVVEIFRFLKADRAAFADFGLDLSCCCSTSASCFSLSAFFMASNLSLCSLRNSVRFFNSTGSMFESANASAIVSTCEHSILSDGLTGDIGEAAALVGSVETADVSIAAKNKVHAMNFRLIYSVKILQQILQQNLQPMHIRGYIL